VSPVLAIPQEPDHRLDDIAARLKAHDWVQDALALAAAARTGGGPRATKTTVLVVPSAAGVRVLRTRGKPHLVAEWEHDLVRHQLGTAAAIEWRLVEELAAGPQDLEHVDVRPAWMPIVSDVVPDLGAGGLDCRLRVPYDMAIFRGHFPSAPIVPGVLQVGWAIELAGAHGLAVGPMTGIAAAKFRRVLRPGMCLDARLERGPHPGQVHFRYTCGDTVVATGRLQFGAAHE
jgi:3-hydroxymyristoyl/3-hydroxydecanoyl-(acyl carrier protein) dehydratase